jgi:circadian clock protein KaiC
VTVTEASKRVPTYVAGLDSRIGGGIPTGSVILIEGPAGCMKSSLAYSILYQNAIRHNTNGLYMTLEQSRKDLEEHMEGLGMTRSGYPDLEKRLTIMDLGELRSFLAESGESESNTDWLKSILKQIDTYIDVFPLDIFVLDSLNALLSLANKDNYRSELFHFIRELKAHKMTTFLIHEQVEGETWNRTSINFLVDGVFRLEAKRTDEMVNLQLGVVKLRKSSHDRSFLPFIVRKGMLEVVGK